MENFIGVSPEKSVDIVEKAIREALEGHCCGSLTFFVEHGIVTQIDRQTSIPVDKFASQSSLSEHGLECRR